MFRLGQPVTLAPPPHQCVQYMREQRLAPGARVEVLAAVGDGRWRVRGDGGQEFVCPQAHLQDPNVIVRAQLDKVGTREIGQLLTEHRFQVPRYQRKYAWGSDQWQGLWRDLAPGHSLGRLTLYAEELRGEKELVVVDGQQRLTTVLILLCALRDAGGDPRQQLALDGCLTPTQDDRAAFSCVLAGRKAPPSRIAEAYEFFSGLARDCGDAARRLASALALKVLVFELDDGEAVTRFFEQLHQREMMIQGFMYVARPGVSLAEVDLLRNLVLGHFAPGPELEQGYAAWLAVERACGADGGDLGKMTAAFERFLARRGHAGALYPGFRQVLASAAPADAAPGPGVLRLLQDLLEEVERPEELSAPRPAPRAKLLATLERDRRRKCPAPRPAKPGPVRGQHGLVPVICE